MVNFKQDDAVEIVRQGLCGRRQADEQLQVSAAMLAERLERVNRLGGMFVQVCFSPAMQTLLASQLAPTPEYAVG